MREDANTKARKAPLLQTCPHPGTQSRKRTRALRHHNSFEKDYRAKNTSAAAGNFILMSEKQNTNKTKQQCSGKTQSDLAHTHTLIHSNTPTLKCQNCSLSLPLQDYRQSAPETKPTHGSSMRTRSLCTRATNKKRSDIHLDNLRGLTAFSQSWQPEEGGEESSLIKQGLGRQMEPLAGC